MTTKQVTAADLTAAFLLVAPFIFLARRVFTTRDIRGRTLRSQVVLRINGRNGTYRVDSKISFLPWEAIDGGEGFATKTEAVAYVRRWAQAVREEETVTPSKFSSARQDEIHDTETEAVA